MARTKHTQAALARALGLSRSAITKLKARGMPVGSVAAARAWRELHLDPALRKDRGATDVQTSAGGRGKTAAEPPPPHEEVPKPPATSAYVAAKTLREQTEGARAQLRLRQEAGELVRKEDVAREAFATFRALRDRMVSIPDRIAATLAAEADVGKVHDLLLTEIKASLRKVIEQLQEQSPSTEVPHG